jgi:hypothetical protein
MEASECVVVGGGCDFGDTRQGRIAPSRRIRTKPQQAASDEFAEEV